MGLLDGWKIKMRNLHLAFAHLQFQHVYGEFNEEVDFLSKQAFSRLEWKVLFYLWTTKHSNNFKQFVVQKLLNIAL